MQMQATRIPMSIIKLNGMPLELSISMYGAGGAEGGEVDEEMIEGEEVQWMEDVSEKLPARTKGGAHYS